MFLCVSEMLTFYLGTKTSGCLVTSFCINIFSVTELLFLEVTSVPSIGLGVDNTERYSPKSLVDSLIGDSSMYLA